VLPSLQEGLPIALVEAMALARPCIASGVNAIPEAITDESNGLLVTPGDPVALREAIERLLSDSEARACLGEAARVTAYEKFDESRIAGRMLELYEEAWQTSK
jgi:glycosyltransferase involved in cell wall biosynthesis